MSRKYRNREFNESLRNNQRDFHNFRNRLIDLAVGRFRIEGLPEEIYEPYMIKTLIADNRILFFKDEDLDQFIAYQFFNSTGKLDIYNRPITRGVQCPNGYKRFDLDESNSVIIYGSMSSTPIINIIEQYAYKLYNISRTIDVNVNAQKTPILLACNENERLTLLNAYADYEGNQPVIKGSKDFNLQDAFQVLNTGAPFVADKLYQLQSNLWNEYLTFLGVSNMTEKKERLITDEVQRTMGGVIVARNNYINAINRSLEDCNKMFGLDMQVKFAEDEEISADIIRANTGMGVSEV